MITTPLLTEQNKKKETKEKVRRHQPKHTLSFLKLFDTSEGIKFLTHGWNSNDFNRETIINIAKKEFENAKKQYSIPDTILSRFEHFAFKENPDWFIFEKGKIKHYTLGWSSRETIEWCNKPMNEGTSPFENANFFDNMIKPFKHSIEVRQGDLPKIIQDVLMGKLKPYEKFKINIAKSLKNATFYTEIDGFTRGLRYLFDSFSEKAEINKCYDIDINYEKKKDSGLRIITITHRKSLPEKATTDNDLLKGGLKAAKKHFSGLCNWSIEAKFTDGLKRIDILNDNEIPKIQTISKEEIGFTHILSFYS